MGKCAARGAATALISTVIQRSTTIINDASRATSDARPTYMFTSSFTSSFQETSALSSITTGRPSRAVGPISTLSAPEAARSSAPLAGIATEPDCSHLWANKASEDWLFAALCSWATVNPKWPLVNLDFVADDDKDPKDLSSINVTTYDFDLKLNDPLEVRYEVVKGDGNADANNAWWGGAFRQAVISTSRYRQIGVTRDWMAWHFGFRDLIGMEPNPEDPSQFNQQAWDSMLRQSQSSPVMVYSKAETTYLKDGDRYFSVTNFENSSRTITLWDPASGGQAGYFIISSEELKEDVQYLWHLAW
ncbi:hypothetical protein I302_103239 [Kwoniella bestiolae CBS 10118]|uniref:Uncharacterized protein n=1 Tax=Kwoniella bestiolae CBS 10118 TaxID=1296100 RepID=A0A1B9G7X3_9TREE|nr:hypothetical protein I302_01938 [Kwoniella bestiolae CBS 10118]OCF27103.1 hypothetical protein I302_01938 [Kwoniella bestiolae CBS 10118]